MHLWYILFVVGISFLGSNGAASSTSLDSQVDSTDPILALPVADQHTDQRFLRVVDSEDESDELSTPKLASNSESIDDEDRGIAVMGNMRGVFAKMKYQSWFQRRKTPENIYERVRGSVLGFGHHDWVIAAGYSKYWYHQLKYGPFAVDDIKKHKKRNDP